MLALDAVAVALRRRRRVLHVAAGTYEAELNVLEPKPSIPDAAAGGAGGGAACSLAWLAAGALSRHRRGSGRDFL